jgi:hypothetical protein
MNSKMDSNSEKELKNKSKGTPGFGQSPGKTEK